MSMQTKFEINHVNYKTDAVRHGLSQTEKDMHYLWEHMNCKSEEEFAEAAKEFYKETGVKFVLVKIWKKHILFWRYQPLYVLASHPFEDGLRVHEAFEHIFNGGYLVDEKPWQWRVLKTYV